MNIETDTKDLKNGPSNIGWVKTQKKSKGPSPKGPSPKGPSPKGPGPPSQREIQTHKT